MHIILGGTGHVGSAVAKNLLAAGEDVTIVTRSAEKGEAWRQAGAQVAIVDVCDTPALRDVFARGRQLFLLNPPADIGGDTAAREAETLSCILAALDRAPLRKIVGESTYGAQPGDAIGDLAVLHDMEDALAQQSVPHDVIRAAYYMSNWDMAFESAKRDGIIESLYPVDFRLPMVAPADIGELAARLMRDPANQPEPHYIEGPARYSAADVAAAYQAALGKPVKAVEIAPPDWLASLRQKGFSEPAAQSMAAMTGITLREAYAQPVQPLRGQTILQDYIRQSVLARTA